MNTLLLRPQTKKQEKILTDIARELGIVTTVLSEQQIEENALLLEIKNAEKTALVDYETVKKEFQKIRNKLVSGK